MIFVTVGSLWPFDRLVRAVDAAVADGVITESVFAQIGESCIQPGHIQYAKLLDKGEFDRLVRECSFVVSHAGIGTIATALEYRKTVVAMPRRKKFGEHVNDHQYDTAVRFGGAGHILVANDDAELREHIRIARAFVAKPRTSQPEAVAKRIAQFLADV